MSYFTLAFFMGLLGSAHCVVMCGPLACALPLPRESKWNISFNVTAYQFGRVATYGLLGLIVGLIGHAVEAPGWQRGISIATGTLLVSAGIFSFFGLRFPAVMRLQQRCMKPITRWIGYWLHRPYGHAMVGMVNGLLPCGMVYVALAAALNAESVGGGGLFMLSFGFGTFPAMLAVMLVGGLAKRRIRLNLAVWGPALCLIMGVWFLLRGANLDIPYLSPLIHPSGAAVCY